MWPDDLDPRRIARADDELPADVELLALEAELSAAGANARRRSPAAPTPAFAAALRERLMTMPAAVATAAAGSARTKPPSAAWALDEAALRPLPVGPVTHAPVPVAPRMRRRTPTVLPGPRWSMVAVAAALVVAVAGLGLDLIRAAPAVTRAASAVGTTLVRDGSRLALGAGQVLEAGDEFVVEPSGSATLQVGGSTVRLAGGSDLALVRIDATRVELDLRAGRAWNRVDLPAGGRYAVTTGAVTWTATGTAFDLDRSDGDGTTVHELSVQHGVIAEGPGLRVSIDEGRGAVVRLADAPTVETLDVLPATAAADPWIRANAAADLARGDAIGMLEGLVHELAVTSASPPASAGVSAAPSDGAMPTSGASAAAATEPPATATPPPPTAAPTPKPTPRPTAKPTPVPTDAPQPTFGSMNLAAFACPGGVLLNWTVPDIASIAKVRVLRGTSGEIPSDGSMSGGVSIVDGASTSNLDITDGANATGDGGSAWYRAIALDGAGRSVAASDVRAVTAIGVRDLGTLSVTPGDPQTLTASWTAFDGPGDCFSYYKLVASADDPTPSYLEGSQYLAAISEPGVTGTTVTVDAPSGSTLYLRLQTIRVTSLGKFIVAQTAPIQVTVP